MVVKIKGKFPSLRGFVLNVINKNQYTALTQLHNLYSVNEKQNCQNEMYIHKILATDVFPCIIHNISRKNIGEELKITTIRIEMYSDVRKNLIRIENTDIVPTITTDEPHGLAIGDEVNVADIKGGVSKIIINNRDENAAIMVFVKAGNRWFGWLDFIYNREYVSQKYSKAQVFLDGATGNLEKSNFAGFYNNLWASFELSIESVLLLHGQIKLGDAHSKITTEFKNFCTSYNLDLFDHYEKLKNIREEERYPAVHNHVEKTEQTAYEFLKITQTFINYVNGFLKERQVILNTK